MSYSDPVYQIILLWKIEEPFFSSRYQVSIVDNYWFRKHHMAHLLLALCVVYNAPDHQHLFSAFAISHTECMVSHCAECRHHLPPVLFSATWTVQPKKKKKVKWITRWLIRAVDAPSMPKEQLTSIEYLLLLEGTCYDTVQLAKTYPAIQKGWDGKPLIGSSV
jgi:hypothetical protein